MDRAASCRMARGDGGDDPAGHAALMVPARGLRGAATCAGLGHRQPGAPLDDASDGAARRGAGAQGTVPAVAASQLCGGRGGDRSVAACLWRRGRRNLVLAWQPRADPAADPDRGRRARAPAHLLNEAITFAKTSPTPLGMGTQTILYYTLIISIGGNHAGCNARS